MDYELKRIESQARRQRSEYVRVALDFAVRGAARRVLGLFQGRASRHSWQHCVRAL